VGRAGSSQLTFSIHSNQSSNLCAQDAEVLPEVEAIRSVPGSSECRQSGVVGVSDGLPGLGDDVGSGAIDSGVLGSVPAELERGSASGCRVESVFRVSRDLLSEGEGVKRDTRVSSRVSLGDGVVLQSK
jgi:hypothetical protein